MLSTPVRALLTREPVCTTRDASIAEVAQIMSKAGVSSILVVDERGTALGLVTTTDLVRLENSNPVYLRRHRAPDDRAGRGDRVWLLDVTKTRTGNRGLHSPIHVLVAALAGSITNRPATAFAPGVEVIDCKLDDR